MNFLVNIEEQLHDNRFNQVLISHEKNGLLKQGAERIKCGA